MHDQASLGSRKIYDKPTYNQTQIGRVTSTANYSLYGRIEVMFLDYSIPVPVWVIGELDRVPSEGDLVLVAFIQGRSDSPYLAGFIRNKSYTSNYIQVAKDKITIQLPTQQTDIDGYLLDDSLKPSRVTIEVTASGVQINGAYAARIGDTVSVNVPSHGTCIGTITSGAAK